MMAASSLMRVVALLALVIAQIEAADARGRGGGGLRGGGASSMSRGGGGGFNRGSAGANRGGGSFNRTSASRGSGSVNRGSGGTYSRPGGGGYSRPSDRSTAGQAGSRIQGAPDRGGMQQRPGTADRTGAGQRAGATDRAGAAQGSRQDRQASRDTNRSDRQTNRDTTRSDRQTNRETNRNTNINNNVDIDVDGGWGGWGGHYDYPIAAGLAIGAVAGMTAAAFGSAYYALPGGCSPYPYAGYSYYSCGGAWYQPQYEGDTVVYVTVPQPTADAQPASSTAPVAVPAQP